MTNIHNNSTAIILSLLLLSLSSAQITSASEVTGTLSSDGSSETQQGALLNETEVTNDQNSAQNNGQLQGSVVQGREEDTGLAAAANLSDSTPWLIPLAVVGVVALALTLLLWRRRAT